MQFCTKTKSVINAHDEHRDTGIAKNVDIKKLCNKDNKIQQSDI